MRAAAPMRRILRFPSLLLLLPLLTTLQGLAATSVCPDVAPAPRALRLDVSGHIVTLPGGKQLQGLAYNGTYIGPTITATLGDEISVDVANRAAVGTSVHWHGLGLQNASWVDGVADVSQAPTPPGSTFR